MMTAAALIAVPSAGAAQNTADDSSWIVVLAPSAGPDEVGGLLAEAFRGSRGATFTSVLNGFTFHGSAQSAALLRNHPWVRAVVPDGTVTLTDSVPEGVTRIGAAAAHDPANGGHTGAGVRIVVIDSGVDLNHPDLMANIDPDTSNHFNCQTPGASADDDNGHGTHVAGTAAAAANGIGVVGVAPNATIVPVKAFNQGGTASTSQVVCGIDHAASLAADGMPTVVNMSFGEPGDDTECDDADVEDILHEAICDLVDTGAIAVAGAGNSASDAASMMPANFAETIAVSAMVDLDGSPGGLGGCQFDFLTFQFHCDDTFAGFSNFGSVIDITAPGALVNSTRPNGTYGEASGTSMAAPHVSGVAALMLAADPTLDVAGIRALMQETGECPDGSDNGSPGPCPGASWDGDPDGIAEPLVNALAAAQAATGIRWASPRTGDLVDGVVPLQIRVTNDDPAGSSTVEWRVDGGPWTGATYNSASGFYESSWDTTSVVDGDHTLEARATNAAGTETASVTVLVSEYAQAVIGDAAIAYWRLAESSGGIAIDTVGGHSSPYVGSPGLGASGLISPEANAAVSFDGIDDLVAVPNAPDINTGGPYAARTIELWFQADDTAGRQVLYEEGGVSRGLALYLDQGEVYFIGWNNKNDDATTPWGPVWVSAPVVAGVPYHAVLTLDQAAGELEGFINGSSVGSTSGVGKLFGHTAKIGLGAMSDDTKFHDGAATNSGYGYHFAGTIDEVAIYNVALSPSQVISHSNAGGASNAVPPSVTVLEPVAGATVSGDAPISVDASDDADAAGTLTVEWRVDGGPWTVASYNAASGHYEATWDTTVAASGAHTVVARAIDSDGAAGTDSVSVIVDNSSPYEGAVNGDGAIAYWRLSEQSGATAADHAGPHDATYVGAPQLGFPSLLANDTNTAVDFDGQDDLVAIAGASQINTGGPYPARTIELWFNADDVQARQVLFEEGGISRGLAIYVDQGSVYFIGWNTKNDDATTPWGPVWVSAPVTAGATHHVALVLGGTAGFEGFVNGTSVGSNSTSGNLFKHGAKVAIGAMDDDTRFHDGSVTNSGRAFHFDGTIDEVALYNTALSPAQLANHVALGGISVLIPPTVSVVEPSDGSVVSGTVPVSIDAVDDADAAGWLTVEWRIDGGPWAPATYNAISERYEASWDTTAVAGGAHSLEARATDSDGAAGFGSVNVTVNNSSEYEAAVVADGAIAYWRLDESSGTTAIDQLGSHDAPYVGSPTLGATGLVTSDSGTAVVFDGTNDLIAVPDAADINTGGPWAERTIELWFKAEETTSRQVLYEEGGPSRGLAMYLDQGSVYFIAWNDRNDDPTSPWGPVWVAAPIGAGTAYHAVLVLDQPGDALEGFLNGSSVGTASGVGNLFRHVANIGIGAMDDDITFHDGPVTNSGRAYFFGGTLDEVAIYNTALTSVQVAGHYALG